MPACPYCNIKLRKVSKRAGSFTRELIGLIAVVVGIVICFSVVGIPIGLILIILGLFAMNRKKTRWWVCPACGLSNQVP